MAMSEEQVKELTKYRLKQRSFNQKFINFNKPTAHELSKIKPPEPPDFIKNPQYSILVAESTLSALKDFSLEINNNNSHPYNDLIMWLVQFYKDNKHLKDMFRINQMELERQQDELQQLQKKQLQEQQPHL